MDIRRQLVRSTFMVGLLTALWATPASVMAGSDDDTAIRVVPLTPTLTLSDSSSVHIGLVSVQFTTRDAEDEERTVITISTPVPITVAGTLANGRTLVLPNNCTGTQAGSVVTTPVRCKVRQGDDENGGSSARFLIEFASPTACTGLSSATPPCSLPFTASVTASKGQADSRPSNPNLSATQSVQLFAPNSPGHPQAAVGDCIPPSVSSTTLSTLSPSLPQTAQTTFGPAAKGSGEPCTPASVGAINFPHGKPDSFVLRQVWFVELSRLDTNVNNGLAAATLQVTNFPFTQNLVLREFANSVFAPDFDPTQSTPVPNCVGSPLQPPAGADSCIRSVIRGDNDGDEGSPSTLNDDDNILIFNLIIRPTGADPGFSG